MPLHSRSPGEGDPDGLEFNLLEEIGAPVFVLTSMDDCPAQPLLVERRFAESSGQTVQGFGKTHLLRQQ